MEIYIALVIKHHDDHDDTNYIHLFNSDKERLEFLCSEWIDDILCYYLTEQFDGDEKEIEKLQKDKLLKVKTDFDNELKSVEIKPNKYSYKNLDKILEKYAKLKNGKLKFRYEISDHVSKNLWQTKIRL